MVAPTLVKITLYDPNSLGDVGTPFVGRARFESSLWRHIQDEVPVDYVVSREPFWVTFGAPLLDTDGETILQPATPGVAWVYLEPTDYGPLANLWWWNIQFHTNHLKCSLIRSGDYWIPTTGGTIDFGDLQPVDPDAVPELPPEYVLLINAMLGDIATLQAEVQGLLDGTVVSINGESGVVTQDLVDDPGHPGFMMLETVGT